jgi:epoxyqueuosine reductase
MKERLREKALEIGFADVGFAEAKPLELYIREIDSRPSQMYGDIFTETFNPRRGAGISEKHPWARSLLVLVRNYHAFQFPQELIGRIGRVYQVDERKEKKEEHRRTVAYFNFLKSEGVRYYADPELPARMSAATAGVVNYGKNCFAYANRVMRGSSWIVMIPLLLDAVLEPDPPSISFGCPSWCRNACMAACPTRAIYGPGKMDPRRCITYNTYYGSGITDPELREPMGVWVYGCDRCQQVCPRNEPYANQSFPVNASLEARVGDFRLERLLAMTDDYYVEKIWPLCFYISKENKAKWQMNAARAMGNLNDRSHIPALVEALRKNPDEAVRGMCAWSLGRLGGPQAKAALEAQRAKDGELFRREIEAALNVA